MLIWLLLLLALPAFSQTYAERLGFPADARVLILHIDDAGMSYDSNQGVIRTVENSPVRSLSVMMPTPWVPQMVRYIKSRPDVDAGLHLTLTSEWKEYRWGPLVGTAGAPGLVDPEGAMWRGVEQVVRNASPDEVEREIRAQVDRAVKMGFTPTHLDSHMGTLFATPEFLDRYVRVGIDRQIPVMMPGGHNTYLAKDSPGRDLALVRKLGERLWAAGLPVLDDLHNTSYGWKPPAGAGDAELRKWRTARYKETLLELKPGLTMVILHNTAPSEVFAHISDSGVLRKADMLAMTDPEFQRFLVEEHFVLTTWREVHERRRKLR
ncbi:MAG: polysaccharide deacetylase family protein [Bryobacteraceae bacterium]|nr:polysaccharide deacetylase family protein [Bryobacteraceae bacterium]